MALRLRPVDTTFHDLFTRQAEHLVVGAGLLGEMLGAGNDRAELEAAIDACESVANIVEQIAVKES